MCACTIICYTIITDEEKYKFQLKPEFPIQVFADLEEEVTSFSQKQAWEREAQRKAWPKSHIVEDRYMN